MIHVEHCTHGVPLWVCRTCCPETVTTTDDAPWTWTVHTEPRRDLSRLVCAVAVMAAVLVAFAAGWGARS